VAATRSSSWGRLGGSKNWRSCFARVERCTVRRSCSSSAVSGTFFLFFGFEVDPGTIPKALPAALVLAIVGAATKIATGWIAARRAGIGRRGRIRAGTALVARGEFSIVIAGIGVTAGAEPDLGPLAACYVLLVAVGGSLLARIADRPAPRALTRR
jgi:CPA2 family monovalent cation:H+ antiporter-2